MEGKVGKVSGKQEKERGGWKREKEEGGEPLAIVSTVVQKNLDL